MLLPTALWDPPIAPWIPVLLGLVLLGAGRRLFWVLVAVVGAGSALWLATEVLDLEPGLPTLLGAVAAGLAGALLAVLVQRTAVAVVGFLAGAWVAVVVLETVLAGFTPAGDPWLALAALLVAGVVGAVVATRLFEAALVVLSALIGAILVVDPVVDEPDLALVAVAILAASGILVQWRALGRRERPRQRRAVPAEEGAAPPRR